MKIRLNYLWLISNKNKDIGIEFILRYKLCKIVYFVNAIHIKVFLTDVKLMRLLII